MSDYLQRRKALRDKFFPPTQNLVMPRLLRRIHAIVIYDEPPGPRKPKSVGFKLRYSRPIGPTMRDSDEDLDAHVFEDVSPKWIAKAMARGLVNAPMACDERAAAFICKALVECCVDWKTVRTDSRMKEACTARRLISYWLHTECALSTPEIGRLMMKDHSSVVVAIRRYRQLMALGALAEVGQ